jgi:alcohol dehydrogenase (cytochrome c)
LHGNEYSKQTWAAGLDEAGRPIVLPGTDPTYDGNLVWPSLQGATNWFSPSYNPETEQFFVATRLMGAVYYKADVEYEEGEPFYDDAAGAIRALDALTGRQQWEFMLHSPPWAGVMATAGGLVFGGSDEGNVFALDAETGKPLWDFQSGAAVRTNPMSFAIDGKQRIVTTTGSTMFVFGLK